MFKQNWIELPRLVEIPLPVRQAILRKQHLGERVLVAAEETQPVRLREPKHPQDLV